MAGDNPNDLEMGKSELELTERNRKTNEDNQESHAEVSHHQKDFIEDELDEEFWIEVTNLRAVEKQIFVNVFFYYFWFPVKIVAEN